MTLHDAVSQMPALPFVRVQRIVVNYTEDTLSIVDYLLKEE
jgi:hypothetical protein